MRPATAISADGPANLYQAVQAGVFPESKNRGALIIMNDRIGAAYYTQKTHGELYSTYSQIKADGSQLPRYLQSPRTRISRRILQQPAILLL
jgi:L-asparaginase/Glu-tRNA(Gln) amidotransferase subunit D